MGNTTTGDVPIYLDKFVSESDFIITTGLVAPHHSAGFSGGRKSIVPGVVSMETLKIHHSLPIRPYEPAINFLEKNPFHIVAVEAARLVKVRFILNVVQDLHKQIIGAVAGDMEAAHMSGVELCRKVNKVDIHGRADLIITSPGGHPRDIDLWQSQKALSVAELVCEKENNIFILVARAEQGIPQLFIDWMTQAKTPQDVIERFRKEGFDVGTNKAFMYARCMLKGCIILVSEALTQKQAHQVKMDWAPDLQTAINMAIAKRPPHKITVLPKAVNIIPNII
jgi:nickel-dependent lactate racemase